jgi:RHS repeat-associated protein
MVYYDHENRLTLVRDQSDNFIVSYGYDWMGRRAYKVYDDVVTWYVYDGAHIIAEYEDGVLARKYVYGPGIDNPVCITRVTESANYMYYYHPDALGSIVALSDDDGEVVEAYSYGPFGEPKVHTEAGIDGKWLTSDDTISQYPVSAFDNCWMFTGRQWDYESGLYYYRARMYHPTIGRFMQTDPIGIAGGINIYAYCLNNPVNWVDPWGLLTVHYWAPMPYWKGLAPKGSWDFMSGHTSITLEDGTYISWWPAPSGRGVPGKKIDSLRDDSLSEERPPDASVKVCDLDEAAIKKWWVNYSGNFTWSNNCADIVREALRQGGMNVPAFPLISTPGDILNAVSPPPYTVVQVPSGPSIYVPNR